MILRPIIQCWMPAALLSPRKLACEQLPHQFFLYIYIYLFIRYKGHALTNGRGCSPGGLNSTTRSALATLADSSDIERPQPNTPNLYFLVSPRKMCGYAQAYGSDSHRRADEQPIIFGDTFESIYSDGTNGIYDIEIVTSYHYSSDLRPIPVGVSFLQNVQEMQPTYVFATNLRLFFRRKVILNIE